MDSVAPEFKHCLDVSNGGVLLALPLLLANGLLHNVPNYFSLPNGYYGLESIFMLLAFMALCRVKSVENLRYCAPGEWGKLLGLDRIPEIKTLRNKINYLSYNGGTIQWSHDLSQQWLLQEDQTAAFYIDGHVRVYHGKQTKLPKHYVTREKLCLRATVDYWVNALDGQPFLYVNKAVDPGLISVMESDIVPQLESKQLPPQNSPKIEINNKPLHKFTLIFDREGYSPELFARLLKRQIACITYHKHPKGEWSEDEFAQTQIKTTAGNIITVRLAERGTRLSNNLWLREIRKITNGGQVSILATDYHNNLDVIAAEMGNRWCQENYFKYMRQHYNLDSLVEYATEEISDTVKLVNPDYRRLDGEIRKHSAKLSRILAKYANINLSDDIIPSNVEKYEQAKALLKIEIDTMQCNIAELKHQRSQIKKHILVKDLPQEERFKQLATSSKYFIDTIKMIAYRAETAMVNIMREVMSKVDDGRSLLRCIYNATVDLLPDKQNDILIVKVHYLASRAANKIAEHLCQELNNAEVIFPGTNMRIIYKLGSS
jgi:hypothetical protein